MPSSFDITDVARRCFFRKSATGLGAAALATLLPSGGATQRQSAKRADEFPNFLPQAKRVIYLLQSGAPSQMDLFDHKPLREKLGGTELPASIRQGQRLTGMTAKQESFPVAPSMYRFKKHGQSGIELSELLPHTARVADELCVIRSMHTEAINHDPAITFFQTGAQLAGRPSMGAWLAYGLGSENRDLPTFVAMVSGSGGQPLYDRLWGSGFLPTRYQGVKFRSVGDPVLFLNNPQGIDAPSRRRMLDDLTQLNKIRQQETGDPEIATRIAQYEMAFRMQTSVPELTDTSQEPKHIFEQYGDDARKPGTFAANCLLARRLAERGVRFIQLFHRGWDQHTKLPEGISKQCRDTDQASAALISDLKQRGLLEDTLVVWAGEFGRTVYCQGRLTKNDYGRDHHPRCFSIWMAGGGVTPGTTYGATDDYGYNIADNPVHVHDLHATMLHTLGIDHTRLTHFFEGRRHRLTDVGGSVIAGLLKKPA
ncbi:MAG: sulfatase [Planctomycetaceae bacterium]|nr:sulfatase [Planctomycetaceae bacterium]